MLTVPAECWSNDHSSLTNFAVLKYTKGRMEQQERRLMKQKFRFRIEEVLSALLRGARRQSLR